MNNKYKFIGSSLLLTTLMLVGGLLSDNVKLDSIRLRAAGNKQTYSFVKRDFTVTQNPVIPSSAITFGYSPMEISELSGVFICDQGDTSQITTTLTGIGWSCQDSRGFKVVNEGLIGVEAYTLDKGKDYYREIGIKAKFDIQGDRECVLGDNSYYLFDLYYYNSYLEEVEIKEYHAPLEYYYVDDSSSVYYELDTEKKEFEYNDELGNLIQGCDIYKAVLKEISIEYSCSK